MRVAVDVVARVKSDGVPELGIDISIGKDRSALWNVRMTGMPSSEHKTRGCYATIACSDATAAPDAMIPVVPTMQYIVRLPPVPGGEGREGNEEDVGVMCSV